MTTSPFDLLPLWAVFVVALASMLGAAEAGFALGRVRHHQRHHEREPPVGGMVAAELGLLALLLAFTFGIAASRFESRRTALVEEANAIGTTYLRAGFLPPDEREQARGLLRDYVDVRLAAVEQGTLATALTRSEEMHTALWSVATEAAARAPRSVPIGLFIESLNTVIDVHTVRVVLGLRSRIPSPIWIVLCTVASLSFAAMGYQAGLAGANRSPAVLTVALTFAAVFWLLVDLDRPTEGMLRVSQQPMAALRASMAPAPVGDVPDDRDHAP